MPRLRVQSSDPVSDLPFFGSKLLAILILSIFFSLDAYAVPSYSRQTGLPCASCHYAPPELNAFGRKFKLEGYTFATKAEVSDDKKDHNSALHLLEAFPLSMVFDTSFTSTTNYDAAGRDANGNNSVYLLARFVF